MFLFAFKQTVNIRLEKLEWFCIVVRIKCILIVVMTKIHAIVIPWVILETIPGKPVATQVVVIIIALEYTVICNDPVDPL